MAYKKAVNILNFPTFPRKVGAFHPKLYQRANESHKEVCFHQNTHFEGKGFFLLKSAEYIRLFMWHENVTSEHEVALDGFHRNQQIFSLSH